MLVPLPIPFGQPAECPGCSLLREHVADLKARLHNALTSLYAMTERAEERDRAVNLCGAIAELLEPHAPEFYHLLGNEEREAWDDLAPYGEDDDGDAGGDADTG